MKPHTLDLSLRVIQVASWAALARSVLFGFWPTVLACVLLLVGAGAARRDRTWGLGLLLAIGTAFPVMGLLGVAVPSWFGAMGVLGAVPFVLTWRPMAWFDKGAAVLFAALAIALGVGSAFAWRAAAIA